MSDIIYTGTAQYNLIYIFTIHDDKHDGYLKIGQHSFSSTSSYLQLKVNSEELKRNAHERIKQYTKTAMIEYQLLYTELARKQVKLADGTIESISFSDNAVHEVLDRSGFHRRRFFDTGKDSEWFKVDLDIGIAAIKAVKQGRNVLTAAEISGDFYDQGHMIAEDSVQMRERVIKLRDEQSACIAKTKLVFKNNNKMLWDCKMRFGKTITAYSLVKEMGYKKVIVVTHRPAVADGWNEDFKKVFNDDRVFITKRDMNVTDRFTTLDASIDAKNDHDLQNLSESGKAFIYFASMQDLRGSKVAGGKFEKNRAVFSMDWDIIIYDEAHEGTQTQLGLDVQKILEKPNIGKGEKKVLELSGTPYNLLGQYEKENMYSWDYVMEQKAKKEWDSNHPGDHNPYEELPEMHICTFDLRKKMLTSYRYEDENIAFNFREFFRVWTGNPKQDFRSIPEGEGVGDFVHRADVLQFLNLITEDSDESNYPFATQQYREMFKHTFWILPGVKEARAFSALMKEHSVFKKYEIVNVAGDGDVEQPYEDALKAVRDAIKAKDYTITLSCGKLTTGVTVKEWTGVMLLSGSSSTGAAGYMQTIFRAQSAGNIDGKQKKNCYAFDFAPDRALKVIAEVHEIKKSAVGTDDAGRIKLGEFLNFCPVLSEGNTGMEFYDVPKMMRQIKRMIVDAAVKSGFDDNSIYKSDAGIVVSKDQLKLIDILNMRLIPQKKGKKQTTVSVNDQGLTNDEYRKAQDAKRKCKKERTVEEREALKKEKEMKKKQIGLFDLLRNISIRLPLLIYGTSTEFDESICLSDFIDIVDDESWKEFMPKEVDKELFLKLLVFYDEDVIEAAGMRIRRLAKAADEMMPTQRILRIAEIFSYFRNPAKETVLTPWRIVNMHMGETVGGYNFYKEGYLVEDGLIENPRLIDNGKITDELFLNENVSVLEMNSKSGLYPLYIVYSIYRMLLPKPETELTVEEAQEYWREALNNHLYVLCQTKMAVSITRRTLIGYSDYSVNSIYLTKLLERMKDKKRLSNKLRNPKTWGKEGEKLKFDAIVGNPPYQDSTSINNRSGAVYPYFYDLAEQISDRYTLISPARFLFNAGLTSKEWNKKMLSDPHLKVVKYESDATKIFPNTDIKGGVAIIYRDAKTVFGAIEEFISDERLRDIAVKVKNVRSDSMVEIMVGGRSDLKFNEKSMIQFPNIKEDRIKAIQEKHPNVNDLAPNEEYELKSSAFDVLPYIFYDIVPEGHECFEILGLQKGKRSRKWVERKYMTPRYKENNIDFYKVFIPKASGNGKLGEAISLPEIGKPGDSATPTFISIGRFSTKIEAENALKYIKTKFARILLGILKITQDIVPSKWKYVPLQNFTSKSDIDWTKTIQEIDKQLYAKYSLTIDEIEYIEKTVQLME